MLRVILLALTIGALAPASAQALTMGPLDFPAEGQRLETGLGEYVIVFSYAVADVTGCGPIVDGETGVEIDAPEMTTFPTALRSPGNYEVFEVLNPASGTLPRTVRWRSYAVCNPPDPNPDDDNEPEALTAYSPWRTLRLECRPGSVWDILYCGKPIPGPDPEPEPSPEPLPEPAPTPVASTNPFAEEDKRTARHISLDIAAFQATMDRCSLTYGAIAIIPKFKKYPKLKLPDWLPDLDPISAGAGIGATICQFAKASVADLKLAWDKVAVDPPDLQFAEVAQPQVRRFPRLNAAVRRLLAGSPRAARRLNRWGNRLALAAALGVAMTTAIERAEGARLAGDAGAQQQQSLAARRFASRFAEAIVRERRLRPHAEAVLAHMLRRVAQRLTATELRRARRRAQRGLAPKMATLLRRAGISAAQVDDVGAGLESLAAIWRPAAPNLAWTRPKHHAEGISVLRSFSVRTTG